MITVCILTFCIPILILPNLIENCFDTPKTLLLLIGTAVLTWLNADKLKGLPKTVIALIAINFASFFYTLNPYYTKVAVALNISCLLIYFFVSLEHTLYRAKIILITVSFSGYIVSLISWSQYFGHYPLMPWMKDGMVFGTIGNSNYLGAYLLFPVFSTLGLIYLYRDKWRYVFLSMLPVIFGAFLIARARASWFGFFLALPIFFYLMRVELKKIILFILVIGLGVSIMYGHKVNEVLDSTSLQFRVKGYFPPAIELIKESPLFGTGLWSYRNQVYEAQAKLGEEFFKGPSEFKPRRVHCEYLEVLVDGGIVGFILCFLFLFSVARNARRFLCGEHDRESRIIVVTASCSIIAILICAVLFFPFRLNSTLFMTCLFLGILEGLCKEP